MATNSSTQDKLYDILPIPGKGYGLIARHHISPGTPILQEPPIMRIPHPAQTLTESQLAQAFSLLTPGQKASVLALHEGDAPNSSKLLRIFKANSFGDPNACWLHPTISRVNHSCWGNASIDRSSDGTGEAVVIAERPIAIGEEVCWSYNHELYEITTARQRAVLLRKQYGFECKCEACDGDTRMSDARRLLIKRLKERLHGLRTSDFERLEGMDPEGEEARELSEEDLWIKEVEAGQARIPSAEKAAKNALLGRLREAEGLPAVATAQCYLHAAEAMHEQLLSTKDVVVLGWANVCRQLMKKAIALVDEARSPYDDDAQMLRATWKRMGSKPCMKLALGFLDGNFTLPFFRRDDEVKVPYAIFITRAQKLEVLSKAEYSALVSSGKLPSALQSSEPDDGPADGRREWHRKLLCRLQDTHYGYKILGAALTCAAPIAAYWLIK